MSDESQLDRIEKMLRWLVIMFMAIPGSKSKMKKRMLKLADGLPDVSFILEEK